VAAGRGFKKKEDLALAFRLAELLHGEIAGTRSLIEAGWIEPQRQIGLSGRTVKPKLIIACGISGAVQFAAGMKGSDMIVSINTDPNAPITRSPITSSWEACTSCCPVSSPG
jgi:electron transfer flavoprotein alpha subunit